MKTYLCLDRRCVKEWRALKPILKEIVEYLQEEWPKPYMVVTSIRRTEKENDAAGAKTLIHVVIGRAIDIRVFNLGAGYQSKAIAFAKRVNRRWCYDPRRTNLSCAFARSHGSGPHIHLQVHPRTSRTALRITEMVA